MRFFLAFLFLFCSIIVSYGQNNYKQGYLLTNTNDTIIGFINQRTSKMNSKSCEFKEDLATANVRIYTPEEIVGYRFIDEGTFYVAKNIEIDSIPRTAFLEYLLKGSMSLYFYGDDKDYYFFEDQAGSMVSITQNAYNRRAEEDKGQYRGIMYYVFKDCPTVAKEAYKTPFSRKSIVGLTKKYNEEMYPQDVNLHEFQTKQKKKLVNMKYSIYGGIGFHSYSFVGGNLDYLNPFKSVAPIIGGQIDFKFPRSSDSFSLLLDLSFSKIKGEESKEFYDYVTKYSFSSLSFLGKLGLKYTYPKGKFRPTIEAGASFSSLFDDSSTYSKKAMSQTEWHESNDVFSIESSFIGYYIAAGLDMKVNNDQFIFLRLGYDKVKSDGDELETVQLKLGYTF